MLLPLKETATRHGLFAKKSLGQNFIFDTNLLDKIVRIAKERDPNVFKTGLLIEVGSGPGGLTRALLNHTEGNVLSIEKDDRAIGILRELQEVYPEKLSYLNQDALQVDFSLLSNHPIGIVANLPYNVATPLLINWLKNIAFFSSLTLMFQKEVAERIVAKPGSKAYGRLAVLVQWLCEAEIVLELNPASFTPPPKVKSCVVALKPRQKPLLDVSFENVEKITRLLFEQRRKMVRQALKTFGNPAEICHSIGIEETSRAEDLPLEKILLLSQLEKK